MDTDTTLADVVSAIEGLAEEVGSLVATIAEMQGTYFGHDRKERTFLRTYAESRQD